MTNNDKETLPAVVESQDIFARFEDLDDKLILKELENQVVDSWVYHFTQEGHEIWGLGKVGIDACAKEMGKKGVALREDSVEFAQDPTHPEYVLFTAKVSKHVVDKDGHEAMVESAIGTKRQWIMLKKRGGEQKIVSNKFWFEQGSIKALRNAKSRLIPDDIKTKIIEFAKSHKKVKEILPPVSQKRDDEKPKNETEKETKEETENNPQTTTGSEFPDDKEKSLGFPPEEKERMDEEKPTHKEMMDLSRIEATLVDKYGMTPDALIEKLEEKFGESDMTKMTKQQTKEAIEFLKKTEEFQAKKKGK